MNHIAPGSPFATDYKPQSGRGSKSIRPDANGNPWGLTALQCEICTAMIECPTNKTMAKYLGTTPIAVADRTKHARRKTGARSNVELAVMYDRWARGQ